MDSNQLTETDRWVTDYGDYLYSYAMVRVRSAEQAEELVQETFLAALKSRDAFSGRSSARTWLVGILKHKLIDLLRTRGRERPVSELEAVGSTDEGLFDEKGFWDKPSGPADWPADPAADLERGEFWQALRDCLGGLPPRHAEAFALREMDDLPSEEVCKVLNVTPTNLWVMLHRARAGLRRCLEMSWFQGSKDTGA